MVHCHNITSVNSPTEEALGVVVGATALFLPPQQIQICPHLRQKTFLQMETTL